MKGKNLLEKMLPNLIFLKFHQFKQNKSGEFFKKLRQEKQLLNDKITNRNIKSNGKNVEKLIYKVPKRMTVII